MLNLCNAEKILKLVDEDFTHSCRITSSGNEVLTVINECPKHFTVHILSLCINIFLVFVHKIQPCFNQYLNGIHLLPQFYLNSQTDLLYI